MLIKGAIEFCKPDKDQFLSHYFLVPKPDGTDRFILNLKALNKFVLEEHFKLEDIRTAAKLIFPNYPMSTLDLKDAYFLVPIHKTHKKFLRFKFNEELYQFTCLPFGLSSCPYVFTKLLKPVMRHLRSQGLSSIIYLDDILCVENSFENCSKNVNNTIKL